jgi:DNA-binding response OmpR family regulator
MPFAKLDSVSSPVILVVDNSVEMVEFLRCYLSRHGLHVLSATNGQECLETVRTHPVDIVVLDVVMPGMDGFQTCAALKAMSDAQEIPVLFLTAKDDNETRLAGIKLGICEFLTKPVRGHDLLECIRTQLAVRRWEQELDGISAMTFHDEMRL